MKKVAKLRSCITRKKTNSTRKGMNCPNMRTKLQKLPHIIIEKRRLEDEHEFTNTQLFCATIPTHKTQEE
jgi:hypothetical protein